ncbi:thioester reductase domain-containing protein [Albimonas sp. CAU 1670]|uniref:type I polyketide synthase n=1 Tax=Albimonas sp. CAU 1670 TaxID=3032599 RepID=UPI0023DC67EE|nr:type I polyketide synthase [Albimonas sp. CAU 1670]MDF2235865.1 thioester reductase domain-containing protein [Albimonas sp. CAU 1670]
MDQSGDCISIVGMGCLFPGGADSPERLWSNLLGRVDSIAEIPDERWAARSFHHPQRSRPLHTYSRWAGLVDGFDRFDAGFFGLSDAEAECMDPQHRMLLRVAWEALEDAGHAPRPARADPGAPRVGVFVGLSTRDYADGMISRADLMPASPFTAVGGSASMASNRISHALNLAGPSLTVDTACSSSLVALHLARRAIAAGDCDLAVVGGVNLVFQPHVFVSFSASSMLSADGRCKAFDARADGFVRAEGAGAVILRRTSQALADGDRIYARLLGAGVNQDGRTRGIFMPSEAAQVTLARETAAEAGISPAQVRYIEAHGTGTAIGDPIEARAVGSVYGAAQSPGAPCPVGSIKTNIGHLEAGAGIAGLIKTCLVLSKGVVPPNLHFETPNPEIDFAALGLEVATEARPFAPDHDGGDEAPPCAAINSFGFGGTNAHAILAPAPRAPAPDALPEPPAQGIAAPLLISGPTPEALRANAARMAEMLADGNAPLDAVLRAAALRRPGHARRLAVFGDDREGLGRALAAFAAGAPDPDLVEGAAEEAPGAPVFVYSGQGPQWWAMGRQLYAAAPRFRATVDACDEIQRGFGGWPLREALLADECASRMTETAFAQPCIFAVQAGLTELWRALGVVPTAVVGHSVGEVAAAWASGALDLEQAVRVIYERGRVMELSRRGGAMLAVACTRREAERLDCVRDGSLEIAALNGPRSVVLAGEAGRIDEVAGTLAAAGLGHRRLPVAYAFHSRLMDPCEDALREALADVAPGAAAIPFHSTVTGGRLEGEALTADYWWRNIRRPVRFAPAVEGLARRGHAAYVEIGPHPVLGGDIRRGLAEAGRARGAVVAASLVRGEDEGRTFARAAARLHCAGIAVDWSARLGPRSAPWARLPTHAWQEKRLWVEAPASQEARLAPRPHAFLAARVVPDLPVWRMSLEPRIHPFLGEHQLRGQQVFPGTGYVEMALAAARELAEGRYPLVLEELRFEQFLALRRGETPQLLRISLDPATRRFEIASGHDGADVAWVRHAVGKAGAGGVPRPEPVDLAAIRGRCPTPVDPAIVHEILTRMGLSLGPRFQLAREIRLGEDEVLMRIETPEDFVDEIDGAILPPTLLDNANHALALVGTHLRPGAIKPAFYAPSALGSLRVFAPAGPDLWIHVRLREANAVRMISDYRLLDDDGAVIAEARGFEVLATAGEARSRPLPDALHYASAWRPAPSLSPGAAIRPWSAAGIDALAGAPPAEAPGAGARPAEAAEQVWAALAAVGAAPDFGPWREALRRRPGDLGALALMPEMARRLDGLRRDADAARALLDDPTMLWQLNHHHVDGPGHAAARGAVLRALDAALAAMPDGRPLRVLDLGGDAGARGVEIAARLAGSRGTLDAAAASPAEAAMLGELLQASPWARVRVLATDAPDLGLPEDRRHDLLIVDAALLHSRAGARLIEALPRLAAPGARLIALAPTDPAGFDGLLSAVRRAALDRATTCPDDAPPPVALPDETATALGRLHAGPTLTVDLWAPVALPEEAPSPEAPHAEDLRWLLLPDAGGLAAEMAARLSARFGPAQVALVETDAALDASLAAALDGGEARIVDFGALGAAPEAAPGERAAALCGRLARLAQRLAGADAGGRATLRVITSSAHAVADGEGADAAQAAVCGFGRTLVAELPELDCRLIDLSPAPDADEVAALEAELALAADAEDQVALRGGVRHLSRIAPLPPLAVPFDPAADSHGLRLGAPSPGALDRLALEPAARRAPGPGEIEVQVEAAGVNFRDVLKALRLYPLDAPDALDLGDECAGRICAVGEGVTGAALGQRVVVLGGGCFASHVTVPQAQTLALPDDLDAAEAATLLVPWMTARHALIDIGRLEEGERVLVHAGAGGVGLAAIQIALAHGAEVHATAGSPLKRGFLRALGVEHVYDSRTEDFADAILRRTGGEGVDVVLNSLAGDLMARSIELLRDEGRFLELGKRDIEQDTLIGLRPFRRALTFAAIDMSKFRTPRRLAPLLRALEEALADGSFRPLPHRRFGMDDFASAFQHMARARHIGKIALTFGPKLTAPPPARDYVADPEAGYLVTGGLRGLGLALAVWLADRGARRLCLVSRTGAVDAAAAETLDALRREGVEAIRVAADVATREGAEAALAAARAAFGPLKGVIHAAARYGDRMLMQEDEANLGVVFGAKAAGAWNLHALTAEDPLDLFVTTSSISAVLGGIGQAAYAGANAFLDGLAAHRRAQGLPALSVNLDPVTDAGFLTRDRRVADYLRARGFDGLTSAEVARSIGRLAGEDRGQAIVTSLAWKAWARSAGALGRSPRFAEVAEGAAGAGEGGGGLRADLLQAAPAERLGIAAAYLAGEIAQILRLPAEQIDPTRPMADLGVDSLSMVELVLRLETDLGVGLPASLMAGSPTLERVAGVIAQRLASGPSAEGDAADAGAAAGEEDGAAEMMARDARLAETLDFGALAEIAAPAARPKQVLLTGGTGALGAQLVAELLRFTDVSLTCLVRAPDAAAARARLLAAVADAAPDLPAEVLRDRLEALPGTLEAPLFGLPAESYDALAARIEAVFHLAADVKHVLPYAALRGPNVEGTLEVIRFAMHRRVKRLHHASTIAIFSRADAGPDGVIHEHDAPAAPERLAGGYTQSKWVAEALATSAGAHGLPVAIHRLGVIVGKAEATGAADLVWRAMEASRQAGAFPRSRLNMFLTPADFAVRAMRRIFESDDPDGGPYAIVGAAPLTSEDVADALERAGGRAERLEIGAWAERIAALSADDESHPLAPYIRFAETESGLGGFAAALETFLSAAPAGFARTNLDRLLARDPAPEETAQRDTAAAMLAALLGGRTRAPEVGAA